MLSDTFEVSVIIMALMTVSSKHASQHKSGNAMLYNYVHNCIVEKECYSQTILKKSGEHEIFHTTVTLLAISY